MLLFAYQSAYHSKHYFTRMLRSPSYKKGDSSGQSDFREVTDRWMPKGGVVTGIDFITPSEKDAITLDNIRQSIYQNQESAEQIHQFLSLIKKYGQDHSIVIACTELSIARQQALAKEKGSTIEIYDMSEIQIKKALTNRFDS